MSKQVLPKTLRRSNLLMKAMWQRAAHVVSDDGRFLRACAVLLGLVALLKGIRMPNAWSATQAQLDYRHGLIRRALFGQLTRSFHLDHYARFAVFSLLVLAVTIVLLVRFAQSSGVSTRVGNGAATAIFFSSFAFTYLGNLTGYLDVIQLSIAAALLLIRAPMLRLAFALPLCVACVLMHEGFLLLFLPILLFSFFTDWLGGCASKGMAVLAAGTIAVLCFVSTVVVAAHRSMTQQSAFDLQKEMAARVDFTLAPEFFAVLGRSTGDNLRYMFTSYTHSFYLLVLQLSSLIIFAPVLAALLFFGRRLLRTELQGRQMTVAWVAFVMAACAPLLMYPIGLDVARWDAYACISAFLALALVARALPRARVEGTPVLFRITVLILALNMACGENLLDVAAPNSYPFLYNGVRALYRHSSHVISR